MMCPSCKRDNLAGATHCVHCGSELQSPTRGVASRANTPTDPESKTTPSTQPSSGMGYADDLTIDGGTEPKGSPTVHGGGSVSVQSKTPSGGFTEDERTMDGAIRSTGLPSPSPSSPASPSPSSSISSVLRRLAALEPGMDFGPRFRIEQLLGSGGMGKVYKAFDKELSRTVALKTLQPELVSDPMVALRFKQELLLASKISHRNILRIHDLSEVDGIKYISMAFIEGTDLAHLLKAVRPFPLERTLTIARQLCEALDAAHAEGVVHRDFKPQNVLVGANDHVYVSDFGLATSFETAKMGMTRSGTLVGTPRYMSPEQVEGKPVDTRSDLYSLGLVLYEMATGETPFTAESTWQLMYQRVKETPRDVRQLKSDLPDYVARIIMHCLEKDPADRYQSTKEILSDLDAGRGPTLSLSQTLHRKLPVRGNGRWYAVGATILIATTLFFAIPKARHFVFPVAPEERTRASIPTGLPALSEGKFVAVLPFRALGDQGALGYVAEGISEAISTKLFQLKDVRLASSAAAAKTDPKAPMLQVAKELGVNLIVHGTVQGTGNNLRITVNLENVAENRLAWTQEFTGISGDLLTIEDQIYTRLTDALEMKPSNEEMAAASAHPTENIEAYNQYLKGRNALSGSPDEKNIQAAMNFFSDALKKDPSFALAYTGLADANLMMYTEKKDRYWSERAVEAAKQAARLNDKLPEVHAALGSAYAATGQTAQAIVEDKRALELAPNSDEAYRRLGNAYRAAGQKTEALQALEKAVALNPYYWNNLTALGRAYFEFEETEKAAKMFERVIQIEPDNLAGYNNLGVVYLEQGKYEESIPILQKALQIQPSAHTYTSMATAYFYLKRYAEAIPMFEKAVELSPDDESNMGNLADGYRWAGDKAKAQAAYDKAIALAYKELKVNPRQASVIGNLALYYAKKGDVPQAKEFVRKARAIDSSDVYLTYIAAVVDTIDNQPAEAVRELSVALLKGYSARSVEVDPEFGSLQSRPDYQAMMKRFATKKG